MPFVVASVLGTVTFAISMPPGPIVGMVDGAEIVSGKASGDGQTLFFVLGARVGSLVVHTSHWNSCLPQNDDAWRNMLL